MKNSRKDREHDVLMGLVDLYLKEAKPIGSNTLKDSGFEHLSSATIRNYFARLEIEGFLKQHHSSGGRVPTDKAFRLYAQEKIEAKKSLNKDDEIFLSSLLNRETKEISTYLQEATAALSELTNCAGFITAPRFDQDFIVKIHLLKLDEKRALCVIVTDFSLVHTEILYLPRRLSTESLQKIEQYFHFRLTGLDKPELDLEEYQFAQQNYNEIVLRHFVSYTNMQTQDIYRSGFAKLLTHPEFHDPIILTNALSLFESRDNLHAIMKESFNSKGLKFWIGDDLKRFIPPPIFNSMIAIPYRLHNKVVGTIAILGPDRMDYERAFGLLEHFSHLISENLTKSMYKFKLTYRQPQSKELTQTSKEPVGIGLSNQPSLIENKDEEK